jgi:hypothetical protein
MLVILIDRGKTCVLIYFGSVEVSILFWLLLAQAL